MKKKILLKELVVLKKSAQHFITWVYCSDAKIKFKMEILLDNINAALDETYTLPNQNRKWPHFKEAFLDYKAEYYSIVKMASVIKTPRLQQHV
jgi:hypothetical protein